MELAQITTPLLTCQRLSFMILGTSFPKDVRKDDRTPERWAGVTQTMQNSYRTWSNGKSAHHCWPRRHTIQAEAATYEQAKELTNHTVGWGSGCSIPAGSQNTRLS